MTTPPYLGSVTGTVAGSLTMAISTVLLLAPSSAFQSMGTWSMAHWKS